MKYIISIIAIITLAACSSISALEGDEQLFTGLEKIDYQNFENNTHQSSTQEEIEAALASAPSGALMGSSYVRTPFPIRLWIWNACSQSSGVIKKWLNKSFGKAPVLINNVNPSLRSIVARTVLQNNGYFRGFVDYDIIEGKPTRTKNDTTLMPRTAKVKYKVNFGELFYLDSISYTNYPKDMYDIICTTPSYLTPGSPFSISSLDAERARIYNLLRNKGYYFYQQPYTSYLADTIQSPGKVQLRVHFADSLSDDVTRKWVIGKTSVQIRKQAREELTDSIERKYLKILYSGKKPPLRPRVILADMKKIRPGDIFSEENYEEALENLHAKGIYSSIDVSFTPRRNEDGTTLTVSDTIKTKNGVERKGAGVLDMTVNTVLDKPYDYTFLASVKGKTSGRLGPGLSIGFNRRNAFRGGELFGAEIGANYEFQTGGDIRVGNSYDFSTNMSLQMPRLMIPSFLNTKRKRWYSTPNTTISLSGEMIRRAGYFNRYALSAKINYTMQPSATSMHQFAPIMLTYGMTSDITDAYFEKISTSTLTTLATSNELIPKMIYKYIYTSLPEKRNSLHMELTLSEAGNITNALYLAIAGKKWNDKAKEVLNTEFSQFAKAELDICKLWRLSEKSNFVAHVYAGYMQSFGNSRVAPFSEAFFIGGANDLRGFSMRSIGPGTVHFENNSIGYTLHNGNIKGVINLEYRPHILGSLYGALFLDAGNVWDNTRYKKEDLSKVSEYTGGSPRVFDAGINVGLGLRYDLDFFVVRIDWGYAIHNPYDTGKNGFFNVRSFKNAQCLNFALGYPF